MEFTVEGLIQLVTAGGFGALAWYLIAIRMPKMQERFDAHDEAQQAMFTDSLNKIQSQFTEELTRRDDLYRTSLKELMTELVAVLKASRPPQP